MRKALSLTLKKHKYFDERYKKGVNNDHDRRKFVERHRLDKAKEA